MEEKEENNKFLSFVYIMLQVFLTADKIYFHAEENADIRELQLHLCNTCIFCSDRPHYFTVGETAAS
jgi:hypothetical protein